MASVPLAIVVVAALVVPLAVIPGTFGFDRWPSSRGEQVTERQVRLAPPKVDVVAVRPRHAAPARQPVLVDTRPRAARVAPTVVAVAPAPRRSRVAPVSSPAPKPDRTQGNATPQPRQPQPQPQPQQDPQQPTKNDPGLVAGGNVPVARELAPQHAPQPQTPAPAPERAPAPVPQSEPAPQPVQAPVERVAPPHPCNGEGDHGGQQGDGDAQQ